MAAWVWVLIRPGARMASGRSRRWRGWKRASISALVPTPTMRSPRMATAPFSITRLLRVFGDDIARAPDPIRGLGRQRCRRRGRNYRYETSKGFGKRSFKPIGFGLAARVDQHDLDVAAELPEDLAAGAAGRGEHLGIGGHGHAAELARAFGDGLENGHALGADGEPVGGVFHVAAGVDAAIGVFHRGAHPEFGIRREGVFAGGQRGGDQRVGHPATSSASFGSSAFRNRTSVSRTMAPVSSTSSWLIFLRQDARRHVGDAGNAQHLHAHVVGHDHFRHGGHAHHVGADGAQIADLRGRLVARPQHGRVHAFGQGDAQLRRPPAWPFRGTAASRLRTCRESAARSESSFGPTSGIRALQVDVVGDQHQPAALERQVDAAGGVGEHHGAHAQAPQHAHAENHLRRRIAFVEMRAAGHHRHVRARRACRRLSLPAWPTAVDRGPAGNLGVGDLRRARSVRPAKRPARCPAPRRWTAAAPCGFR